MVQAVRDFAEGCRRGLSIMVACRPCARREIYLCRDFEGYISRLASIEYLTWRCTSCRTKSHYVRYMITDLLEAGELKRWTPPPSMQKRYGIRVQTSRAP